MTRSVTDMLTILDVLTQEDPKGREEFWRQQSFVKIPKASVPRSYLDLLDTADSSLRGKRIAVPKMYIGEHDPEAKPTVVSQDVIDLWRRAREDLEFLGATVVETDCPLVTRYEDDSVSGHTNSVVGFKPDWNSKERGELVAYLWDDFLKANGDTKYSGGLSSVDGIQMFPRPADYVPDRYMEHKNFMNYPNLVELARDRHDKSIWDIDGIAEALPALEAQRKRDLEEWMDSRGIDLVVFPANGDVGRADVDTNDESAKLALSNGVKYSNGNRAIRHMGVPTVSVGMGIMASSKMPVNLTFAGKSGQDSDLLRYAYTFEKHTQHRVKPPVTPTLASDSIFVQKSADAELPAEASDMALIVDSADRVSTNAINVKIRVEGKSVEGAQLEAYVDGRPVHESAITRSNGQWLITADFTPFKPPTPLYGGIGLVVGNINIIVLARHEAGVVGKLITIPQE